MSTPRLAIVCDFLEERWFSMDLVAEMLHQHLHSSYEEMVSADLVRPKLRRRVTAVPRLGTSRFAWNADRLLNRFIEYPRYLRNEAGRYDLFHVIDHSYAQLVSNLPPERTIVTCHDLDAFRCLTAAQSEPRPRWFRAMTERILTGLQRAAMVTCVSATVRDEGIRAGLLDSTRSQVIYNGVHPACTPEPNQEADRRAAELIGASAGTPLLLHVGSSVHRKRIDLLLQVFAGVREHFPTALLLRVGGSFTAEQNKLAADLQVGDAIRHLPVLDRPVLAAVYRKATLLLQTSQAEGFGLPVIEAMGCGCPVLISSLPVFHEVGGDAAEYRKVGDISGWTEAATILLAEQFANPHMRQVRRERSLAQASKFSWAESARQTVLAYKKILSN